MTDRTKQPEGPVTAKKLYGRSEIDQPRFSSADVQLILNENKSLKIALEDERAKAKGLVEALEKVKEWADIEINGKKFNIGFVEEALAQYRKGKE